MNVAVRRKGCSVPDYTPNPIDTANVDLPPDLEALLEYLARNVHEVWAVGRMAQGWRYGPARDDVRKEHPCLVPYDDLPESEKLFDRSTTSETLRAILALGYRIERDEG
jgi:ryanodine receptor 2